MDDYTNPKFRSGPWMHPPKPRPNPFKRILAAALLTLAAALIGILAGTWATKAIGQAAYDAVQFEQ